MRGSCSGRRRPAADDRPAERRPTDWWKCHDAETDLDYIAMRQRQSRRSFKIGMARPVRTYGRHRHRHPADDRVPACLIRALSTSSLPSLTDGSRSASAVNARRSGLWTTRVFRRPAPLWCPEHCSTARMRPATLPVVAQQSPITFRGALQILGHHDRPWVDRPNALQGAPSSPSVSIKVSRPSPTAWLTDTLDEIRTTDSSRAPLRIGRFNGLSTIHLMLMVFVCGARSRPRGLTCG